MMSLPTRTIIMLMIFLQFCLIRSFHCHKLFSNKFSRLKPSALASNVNNKPTHENERRINLFQEPDNESPEEVIQGAIGVKSLTKYLLPVALIGGIALFSAFSHNIDVSQFLSASVQKIEELGPYGYLYFALVYITAELLAIPVFPLTASSGYLFGLLPGTLLVVGCATIAASVSFFIGRTFLKDWAQSYIQKSEIWRLADKAIAKEGFKFVLLLRLSPLLPFAVANYLYAVTSVDFWSFIAATFLGFLPGSFGFVYFGNAGKELFSGHQGMAWYMYAAIGALIVLLGKSFTTIAMNAVNEIKKEEEEKERELEKTKGKSS